MTQKEKKLLLQDLCARLPYYTELYSSVADGNWAILTPVLISNLMSATDKLVIKPYLRSLSDMTEEEKNELRNILWFGYPSDDNDKYSHRGIEVKQCLYDDEKNSTYDFDDFRVLENFLLKNHFDYRGLIPMGLAIKAPKDMYNSKP